MGGWDNILYGWQEVIKLNFNENQGIGSIKDFIRFFLHVDRINIFFAAFVLLLFVLLP